MLFCSISQKKINILCLGDSLTECCQWIGEVHRRTSKSDGTPKGLGLHGVEIIGSRRKDEVGCEPTVAGNGKPLLLLWKVLFLVECRHDKTVEDQHSLWKDENGNVWQIETLEQGYL